MPGPFQSHAPHGLPIAGRGGPHVGQFQDGYGPVFERPSNLVGQTLDVSGAALANCIVTVYHTADDSVAGRTISDGSGNYLVPCSGLLQHYVVAYLPGSPDVAGTTANTLVGA